MYNEIKEIANALKDKVNDKNFNLKEYLIIKLYYILILQKLIRLLNVLEETKIEFYIFTKQEDKNIAWLLKGLSPGYEA